jgi:hypothetical protein
MAGTESKPNLEVRHVAQKARYTAVDGRTTRHLTYQVSQRLRKRVEEIFGWLKTVGMTRKVRHRGLPRVDWNFTFALAAYNLVRIRNITASTVWSKGFLTPRRCYLSYLFQNKHFMGALRRPPAGMKRGTIVAAPAQRLWLQWCLRAREQVWPGIRRAPSSGAVAERGRLTAPSRRVSAIYASKQAREP